MPIKKEIAPLMRAGATTRQQLRYVYAISKLVGIPGIICRTLRAQKVIWVGVVAENCPNMTLEELKKYSHMRSHGCFSIYKEAWHGIPWRDRHGWLLLTESVVNDTEFVLSEYNLKLLKGKIEELEVFYENLGGKPKGSEKLGRGGFLP